MTWVALTLNDAVVPPAAIDTLAGTVRTSELAFESAMTAPPAGAGPEIVIDPVELTPPVMDVGLSVIAVTMITLTAVAVDLLTPPKLAVTLTVVSEVTCLVSSVNVAEVAPDFTRTVAGTVPAELSDESWTEAPPVGAVPLSVTVPVSDLPPTTDVPIV